MEHYSQANELEADRLGGSLMTRAGFDQRGAISMQTKLASMGDSGNSFAQKLLGTHPIRGEQTLAIGEIVARYLQKKHVRSTKFQAAKIEIKSRLNALKAI